MLSDQEIALASCSRKLRSQRLEGLFIKLLYRENFEIFVPYFGKRFYSDYATARNKQIRFDGCVAFVMLPSDEFMLCELMPCIDDDGYRYMAHEVKSSFSRAPVRILKVNQEYISCLLVPCLKS